MGVQQLGAQRSCDRGSVGQSSSFLQSYILCAEKEREMAEFHRLSDIKSTDLSGIIQDRRCERDQRFAPSLRLCNQSGSSPNISSNCCSNLTKAISSFLLRKEEFLCNSSICNALDKGILGNIVMTNCGREVRTGTNANILITRKAMQHNQLDIVFDKREQKIDYNEAERELQTGFDGMLCQGKKVSRYSWRNQIYRNTANTTSASLKDNSTTNLSKCKDERMEQLNKIEANTATRIQLQHMIGTDTQDDGQGCSTAFQQQVGNDGMGLMENNVPDKLQPMRTGCYPSSIETILADYIAHESRRNNDQIRQLNQCVLHQQMPCSSTSIGNTRLNFASGQDEQMDTEGKIHSRNPKQSFRQLIKDCSIEILLFSKICSIEDLRSIRNQVILGCICNKIKQITSSVLQLQVRQVGNGDRRTFNTLDQQDTASFLTITLNVKNNQENMKGYGRVCDCNCNGMAGLSMVHGIVINDSSQDISWIEPGGVDTRLQDDQESLIPSAGRCLSLQSELQLGELLFRYLLNQRGLQQSVEQIVIDNWKFQWRRHVSALSKLVDNLKQHITE
ncbi:MAG: hypothetical protein EZS28_026357 [Streblomastix strix]|uniref:Uncharacterized protein n=1 Tax=Streblomastix strix TaxID=222440 RepID=A0A5J4V7J1_9EUKA|nr:MAG: hypothetical protein EZS28_026357 [Streblomastix strix]